MELKRNGTQASGEGPEASSTGRVRIDPLFQVPAPARGLGASVTFEPRARTAWHTHPLGQTLIVTAGCGFVQSWGEPVKQLRPGDVVWCPPGEKQWHGAMPALRRRTLQLWRCSTARPVEWMEKVSDEEYRAAAESSD